MSQTALLFPGQGAQVVGMGKDFPEAVPSTKALFDQGDAVLGRPISQIMFEGPVEELTRSDNTQPAIFIHSAVASAALAEAQSEIAPTAIAGLSSGEWAALHQARVLSYSDTLKVLEARGRFMQEACEENAGSMLSVMGLDLETLQQISDECGIQIANLNSPIQTVLSGKVEGIEQAETKANAAGARKCVRLNVAGAFHSELMRSAAEKLTAILEEIEFSEPQIPVLSNVTGEPHTDVVSIKRLMVDQVTSSVQWVKNVEFMKNKGISRYIECGPGRVLCGLVKRIDKDASLHNIGAPSDLDGLQL